MQKCVYTGAGYDFQPIKLFPEIKNWFYSDISPLSNLRYIKDEHFSHANEILPYRKLRLIELAFKSGLNLLEETQYIMKFKSEKNQFLTYFLMCDSKMLDTKLLNEENKKILNENYEQFKKSVEGWEILLARGFFPNKSILELTNNPNLLFIGFNFTVYYISDDEEYDDIDDINYFLNKNPVNKFKNFIYVEINKFVDEIKYIKTEFDNYKKLQEKNEAELKDRRKSKYKLKYRFKRNSKNKLKIISKK